MTRILVDENVKATDSMKEHDDNSKKHGRGEHDDDKLPAPVPSRSLARVGMAVVPKMIAELGEDAARRFLEFFTANINNVHTRRAYVRAVRFFLLWCERRKISLHEVEPMLVAAFVKQMEERYAKPSVKQMLAAVRMLFDWLVVGQVVPSNPASSVRGPRHVIRKGKTPVLDADEARTLLDSIDVSTISGVRDRALIAVMVYSFGRVSAVLGMKVEDFYQEKKRWWFRFHEKGGKETTMPAHHNAEAYVDAYLDHAGVREDKVGFLFRTIEKKRERVTDRPMSQSDAWRMIRRRAKAAGLPYQIGNHTFRATGITVYLKNGGKLEVAQQMAGHSSPRTTKLYDRRDDEVSLDEVERIQI